MNDLKPCIGCGNNQVVARIMISNSEGVPDTWFVRCDNCDSVCTPTNAIRTNVENAWNNLFGWQELDKANKTIRQYKINEQQEVSRLSEDQRTLKLKFEKLMDEYIKYRMLYSGTAGNIGLEERRKLMTKEILAELGWS